MSRPHARAIAEHVGKPLDLSPDDAAAAIVRVADARMAGAIRLVSIERGHDPQKFVAMPFGGGGALHVGALIREIGLKSAVVPRFPGITSALGCVLADLRHDMVQTVNLMLDGLDAAALAARMAAAGKEASAVIAAAGIPVERIDVIYELDMHYLGQTHTVSVPLPVEADARGLDGALVRKAFEQTYSASFSRLLPGLAVRIVSLRVAAIGRRPPFDFSVFAPDASASLEKAKSGSRQVWFDGGFRETAIWSRLALPAGATIEGPAILEQGDATTVIEPGHVGACRQARQRDCGARMSKATAALILGDLQNDFVHPDGAYGRAKQSAADIAALPARLAPLAKVARERGILTVASLFTLVPGRGGNPIISPHLKALRPFLKQGDFAPGSWGQQLVEELAPADVNVEKIAYSAFHASRLGWVLKKCGIEHLYFTGIVTNGGVASTVRDAHVREFHCTVIAGWLRGIFARVARGGDRGPETCRESDHGCGCDAGPCGAIVRAWLVSSSRSSSRSPLAPPRLPSRSSRRAHVSGSSRRPE